ncbi:5-(carboxyamino)imidazole ribonucleotide synthase [Anthocerotibacter panamensis]|uniref:5-(carboxyamino)imidazole ribonucleotide synthase n=1 Tax=Anthocerotibacter panamensis TaxID=2857077 RepID=UPI001C404BFC|nr:5-(carboxyamino)imidazole ribonucleotide synthase [Anthocerotibacter panamensis]
MEPAYRSAPPEWPRIGIVGGGQLGRMLALAGHRLGLEITVLSQHRTESASQVAPSLQGDLHALDALSALARRVEVITFENEWIAASTLEQLARAYPVALWPSPQTLGWIQDKYRQREYLAQAGLPVPAFLAPAHWSEVVDFAQIHGPKLVFKARFHGYDGQGTRFWHAERDTECPWHEGSKPTLVEAYVPFVRELAVMVARTPQGETRTYPVVETRQVNGVCDIVLAPASIPEAIQSKARDLALQAVEAVAAVGVVGVELFQTAEGQVLINELAPRPHNSGHYTIEGCVTSQFEQHLRAILGWPLGDTSLVRPAAVMVNILGRSPALAHPDLRSLLTLGDVHFHWYGKTPRPGRKLGHITALGDTLESAYARIIQARSLLEV